MENNAGFLYVAFGQKHINEAIISVNSLRKINPNINATLITNNKINLQDFDKIQVLDFENRYQDQWKSGTLFKIWALQNSPYDKTFFVDTDTYFYDDCLELFEILKYYDLLIAHSPAANTPVDLNGKKLNGCYPYNTGVIVYNNNEITNKLLKDWLTIYKEKFDIYSTDQPAFMEALLNNYIKVYVLQPIYNFRISFFVSFPSLEVKILHGRPKNIDKIAKSVNDKIQQRTWHPHKKTLITKKPIRKMLLGYMPGFVTKIYKSIKSVLNK